LARTDEAARGHEHDDDDGGGGGMGEFSLRIFPPILLLKGDINPEIV